jgi:hypothetical protein
MRKSSGSFLASAASSQLRKPRPACNQRGERCANQTDACQPRTSFSESNSKPDAMQLGR